MLSSSLVAVEIQIKVGDEARGRIDVGDNLGDNNSDRRLSGHGGALIKSSIH